MVSGTPDATTGGSGTGGRTEPKNPLVVTMGVSGSGKSTIGKALAARLGVPYADADDFHPPANVRKMSQGVPLNDEDRAPWLDAIADWLARHARSGGGSGGVVSCSALKRRYRDRLREGSDDLFFVHLDGSEALLAERISGRTGHFMPGSLLRSQLDTLERLQPDEPGAAVPIDGTPEQVTGRALDVLRA